MAYTIKELADIAGVSVRTLHYYDQIGLLHPAYIYDNGYRIYEAPELTRLQHILFFRSLDFSLKEIQEILDASSYDVRRLLEEQKKLLLLEKKRLEKRIHITQETITNMKEEEIFEESHRLAGISEEEILEFKKEVREKYNPSIVSQSMKRVGSWSPEKMEKVKKEGEDIVRGIASCMDAGSDSPVVQEQIARYHEYMQQFYDCSIEIFLGLGNMYVDDHRFRAYYDRIDKNLAEFMKDAITIYCKKKV